MSNKSERDERPEPHEQKEWEEWEEYKRWHKWTVEREIVKFAIGALFVAGAALLVWAMTFAF